MPGARPGATWRRPGAAWRRPGASASRMRPGRSPERDAVAIHISDCPVDTHLFGLMLARALQTALGLGGLAPVSVAPLLLTRAFSKKAQAATAGLTEEERLAATKDASKKWAERVGLLHDLTGRTAFVTGAAQGIVASGLR